MSGGSFNYLYCKEPADMMNEVTTIEDMSESCIRMGYADIAKDLTRLAEYIKSAYIRIEVLTEQLSEVMRAVEWYQSCDIGEESLAKAIEKYRTGGTK